MKKTILVMSLVLAVAFVLGTVTVQSQPGRDGYGYDYGMGRGYGRQSPSTGKPIDAKEAEAIMKDYLKSTRNPNLKLGKIKDVGGVFEAEILTKNNDLVDRVHVDKETGYIRSAY
jgi:hypothetical protein